MKIQILVHQSNNVIVTWEGANEPSSHIKAQLYSKGVREQQLGLDVNLSFCLSCRERCLSDINHMAYNGLKIYVNIITQ